ncbi:hypothetical protein WICMUC_003271 [Wickerhamomyces mucosus]|uniref:Major facilitator superfamily (MFS) profile domain-containing protein n=1 Tax=Wickerhamomyces mucosus TaxID=1378264 RepID=A0A9P8TD76_9ASCO|nr:hypothetical protein WICMUC_003271 [Wickerhamomyces mucosus]
MKKSGQEKEELNKKLDTHFSVLPKSQVLVVITALVLGALITMIDTIGISEALPYIAADLNGEKTIQWAGTVFSISNSIFTVLSGRFADIFGRKTLLIICLLVTGIFQLAEGLAQTAPQFYIFRAISGLGCGGIIPLSMVIIADCVRPEERAAYQGILGSGIGIGACLGYFMFGGYIDSTSKGWRNGFYTLFPVCVMTASIVWWIVPNSRSKLSKKEILKNIDYIGSVVSTAFLIFLLIPLNCGGILYAWNSTIIIVFFVLAGVCFGGFIIIETYWAKLPIIPFYIFKDLAVLNILLQCIFYGGAYFSMCFYFPFYFSIVRGFSSMGIAGMMQCILFPLGISSGVSGTIITKLGNYNYVIWTGYTSWLAGLLALLILKTDTKLDRIGAILGFCGVGMGFTFQPTQQALQSQSKISDRAVVMATRNAFRYVGNGIGIAISSLIFNSVIISGVNSSSILSSAQKSYIKSHISSKYHLDAIFSDPLIVHEVKSIYMKAIKDLIYLWIPLVGICWLFSFLIKDKGLRSTDEVKSKVIDEKHDV